MDTIGPGIPKVIWVMWLQGYDQAPELVKKCIDSWRAHHPDWQVTLLDQQTVASYLDISDLYLTRHTAVTQAAYSDIVRVNLLKNYGGVWVDATCFCQVPLASWLLPYLDSGFFAFRNVDKVKPLSSWFLVAKKDSYLISQLCAATASYWSDNSFVNPRRTLIRKILSQFLKRNTKTTGFWFTPPITKGLRIYPYFWFHYLFAKLLREDKEVARLWKDTRYYSAETIERIQREGLLEPVHSSLEAEINDRVVPLYKLDWRDEKKERSKNSALSYLLER